MELKILRYKKVYNVHDKTLEIVVSIFIEEKDIDKLDFVRNYEKIVSKCLFPANPTQSLSIYQEDALGKRINALLLDVLNQHEIDYYILPTFSHYHIARYIDKGILDEIVVGINKSTNANGVVYAIKDERVTVGLAEEIKELSIDDDPAYEIDEDFKPMIELSMDIDEDKEESTDDGEERKGGRKNVWWLLVVLLIVALLGCMVAILMSHGDHQNNESPIDTIEQPDSTVKSPDDEGEGESKIPIIPRDSIAQPNSTVRLPDDEDERKSEMGDEVVIVEGDKSESNAGKKDPPSMRGRDYDQKHIRKNPSGSPSNPSKMNVPANPSNSFGVEKKRPFVDSKQNVKKYWFGRYEGDTNNNGIPEGRGTMYYDCHVQIAKYHSGNTEYFAEKGDYFVGNWKNGDIYVGSLYGKDGTVKEKIKAKPRTRPYDLEKDEYIK